MDLGDSEELFHSLGQYAQEQFGFKRPPTLNLISDRDNHMKPLGKTAYYDPEGMTVSIYVDGRHPKDILRSFAHELVHHTQNENGELNSAGFHGEGYAQKNKGLRNMERDAYERGNMCFRDWEDQLKQQKPTIYNERRNYEMSTEKWKNKELSKNLSEKFGIKMDLSKLNESFGAEQGSAQAKEDEKLSGRTEEEDRLYKIGQDVANGAEYEGPRDSEHFKAGEKSVEDKISSENDDFDKAKKRATLEEDSGKEESEHDAKNEMSDDKRIEEMEKMIKDLKDHVEALRKDKDYEKDHVKESKKKPMSAVMIDRITNPEEAQRMIDRYEKTVEKAEKKTEFKHGAAEDYKRAIDNLRVTLRDLNKKRKNVKESKKRRTKRTLRTKTKSRK